jgi:hypothetical protein
VSKSKGASGERSRARTSSCGTSVFAPFDAGGHRLSLLYTYFRVRLLPELSGARQVSKNPTPRM